MAKFAKFGKAVMTESNVTALSAAPPRGASPDGTLWSTAGCGPVVGVGEPKSRTSLDSPFSAAAVRSFQRSPIDGEQRKGGGGGVSRGGLRKIRGTPDSMAVRISYGPPMGMTLNVEMAAGYVLAALAVATTGQSSPALAIAYGERDRDTDLARQFIASKGVLLP